MVVCDKKTFEAEVLQEQRTVLVDFFGDGCAPCKALMPHIEEFEKQYGAQYYVSETTCHKSEGNGASCNCYLQKWRKNRGTRKR